MPETIWTEYRRWCEAAQEGIDTLPKKEPTTAWKRQRSQRTLDLVMLKIEEMADGARDKPGWLARKRELAKAVQF